jgi:3,5-dioxohexanoate:acetyl-CoA acetone transferase
LSSQIPSRHYANSVVLFAQNDTKPELEVYDARMINNIAFLIRQGYLKKPVYIQFVMGVLGGMPPSIENLVFPLESAKRLIGEFEFSACVAGRDQFPMCTHCLLMGGACAGRIGG